MSPEDVELESSPSVVISGVFGLDPDDEVDDESSPSVVIFGLPPDGPFLSPVDVELESSPSVVISGVLSPEPGLVPDPSVGVFGCPGTSGLTPDPPLPTVTLLPFSKCPFDPVSIHSPDPSGSGDEGDPDPSTVGDSVLSNGVDLVDSSDFEGPEDSGVLDSGSLSDFGVSGSPVDPEDSDPDFPDDPDDVEDPEDPDSPETSDPLETPASCPVEVDS